MSDDLLDPEHRLRINWIFHRSGLAGGVKSNRLIAEAMHRRGHQVTLAFLPPGRRWPRPWQLRKLFRRVRERLATRGRQRHHLAHSSVTLRPVNGERIEPSDVPDADVTIATWWETREWIESWPSEKGLRAYFIRHLETHGAHPERVRSTYRLPGLKLVIARWLQRAMAEQFDDPHAVLVPNGVDREQFPPQARTRPPRRAVGMLYGRAEWKAAGLAFSAMQRIREQLPDVRLISFGQLPIQPRHAPPERLEHHLRPAQHELAALYRSCDVWLLPSTTEGFGMPGLEAIACGTPVVSTRCGGPEDYVIDGETGYLVEVGDDQGMAEAALRILRADDERWLAMSRQAQACAREFDWDRSAEKLERALFAALEKKG